MTLQLTDFDQLHATILLIGPNASGKTTLIRHWALNPNTLVFHLPNWSSWPQQVNKTLESTKQDVIFNCYEGTFPQNIKFFQRLMQKLDQDEDSRRVYMVYHSIKVNQQWNECDYLIITKIPDSFLSWEEEGFVSKIKNRVYDWWYETQTFNFISDISRAIENIRPYDYLLVNVNLQKMKDFSQLDHVKVKHAYYKMLKDQELFFEKNCQA